MHTHHKLHDVRIDIAHIHDIDTLLGKILPSTRNLAKADAGKVDNGVEIFST